MSRIRKRDAKVEDLAAEGADGERVAEEIFRFFISK